MSFQDSISATKAQRWLPTIPDLKCLALIPVLFGVSCFLPWPFHRRVACIPRASNFTGGIYDHRYLGWAPMTAVCLFSFFSAPPRWWFFSHFSSSIFNYFLCLSFPLLLLSHLRSYHIIETQLLSPAKKRKENSGQVTLFSEILPAHARNRVVLPTPGGPRRSIAFSSPMRSCWESHVPLKKSVNLGLRLNPTAAENHICLHRSSNIVCETGGFVVCWKLVIS